MRAKISLAALFLVFGSPAVAQTTRHYVFFEFDRHRIQEPSFLEHPGIEGAQLKYSWRELEPSQGEYDFSSIQADLEFLTVHGKRLFVQLQEVSVVATIGNVPDYLVEDPAFGGGANRTYHRGKDDGKNLVHEGWVARRWDPAVRERLGLLVDELGREFDGRIEGLNGPARAGSLASGTCVAWLVVHSQVSMLLPVPPMASNSSKLVGSAGLAQSLRSSSSLARPTN